MTVRPRKGAVTQRADGAFGQAVCAPAAEGFREDPALRQGADQLRADDEVAEQARAEGRHRRGFQQDKPGSAEGGLHDEEGGDGVRAFQLPEAGNVVLPAGKALGHMLNGEQGEACVAQGRGKDGRSHDGEEPAAREGVPVGNVDGGLEAKEGPGHEQDERKDAGCLLPVEGEEIPAGLGIALGKGPGNADGDACRQQRERKVCRCRTRPRALR